MSTLSLTTNLMNTFVGEDSWVYVRVGDRYLRKMGRDLNVGDLVVEHNEGITATLPKVEPFLEESFRYQVAKDTLHTRNREGEDIKNLRILLLRGLTQNSDEDRITLEQRIMREQGADFSEKDYSRFTNEVVNYVGGVGPSAIRAWLTGKVHAPQDWNNFAKLVQINEEFKQIAESFGQDTGYYASYMMFVGIRRTIMSYLARKTGTNNSDGEYIKQGQNAKIPGKYQQEIELVLNRLMPEVDSTKSAGYVTKISKTVQQSKGITPNTQPDPHLVKGVVTGNLDVPLTDVNTVRDVRYLVREALSFAVSEYGKLRLSVPNYEKPTTDDLQLHIARALFGSFAMSRFLPLNEEKVVHNNNLSGMVNNLGIPKEGVARLMQQQYDEFLANIRTGYVDQALQLEPNTIAKLVDCVRMYTNALPTAYHQTTRLRTKAKMLGRQISSASANRKEKRTMEIEWRGLEREREKLVKYMEANYGLIDRVKGLLLNRLAQDEFVGTQVYTKSNKELLMLRTYYEQKGSQFYTKTEVRQLMERLGIPSAVRLYDQRNFIMI